MSWLRCAESATLADHLGMTSCKSHFVSFGSQLGLVFSPRGSLTALRVVARTHLRQSDDAAMIIILRDFPKCPFACCVSVLVFKISLTMKWEWNSPFSICWAPQQLIDTKSRTLSCQHFCKTIKTSKGKKAHDQLSVISEIRHSCTKESTKSPGMFKTSEQQPGGTCLKSILGLCVSKEVRVTP